MTCELSLLAWMMEGEVEGQEAWKKKDMGSLLEPPGRTSPGHPILAPEKALDLQTLENDVFFSLQARVIVQHLVPCILAPTSC